MMMMMMRWWWWWLWQRWDDDEMMMMTMMRWWWWWYDDNDDDKATMRWWWWWWWWQWDDDAAADDDDDTFIRCLASVATAVSASTKQTSIRGASTKKLTEQKKPWHNRIWTHQFSCKSTSYTVWWCFNFTSKHPSN